MLDEMLQRVLIIALHPAILYLKPTHASPSPAGFFLFSIYLARCSERDATIWYIVCRGRNQSLHHTRCCCAVGASGGGSINSRLNSIPWPIPAGIILGQFVSA